MVRVVTTVPQVLFEKKVTPGALSVTVVLAPTFDGLPRLSWLWTVIPGEHTPAVTLDGTLRNTRREGGAAVTSKGVLVAGARAPAVAARVNPTPARSSDRPGKVAAPAKI